MEVHREERRRVVGLWNAENKIFFPVMFVTMGGGGSLLHQTYGLRFIVD